MRYAYRPYYWLIENKAEGGTDYLFIFVSSEIQVFVEEASASLI